jgi:hypothetical protein
MAHVTADRSWRREPVGDIRGSLTLHRMGIGGVTLELLHGETSDQA